MGVERLLHVALLPWHMNPFLPTPRSTRRLPKIPPHLTSLIHFVDLPLPHVDGLPDHAEAATTDLAADEAPLLKNAYDLLEDPVKKFLSEKSPNFLLHDFFPHWAIAAACDVGVPSVFFLVFSAAATAFPGPPEALEEDGGKKSWPTPESMMTPPKWLPSGSTVAFHRREADLFYSSVFAMTSLGLTDIDRFRLSVEGCSALAVRSCPEYEGEYLDVLQRIFRKPVIPVGLLLPPPPATGGRKDDNWDRIFGWLDAQPPKSVVFVNFGSEYKLSANEVHELAYGPELSNVRFLWALRRSSWVTGGDEEALPEGFLTRIEGRGVVSFGWAPQLEILAHRSIGGSLFHSGWGSAIETLRYGHALMLMPNIIDQGLNGRLLVEKGIAVEVERGDDDSFRRNEIAKALQMAMISSEGEGLRRKAREMATVVADQELHGKYIKKFVDHLLEDRNNQVTKDN